MSGGDDQFAKWLTMLTALGTVRGGQAESQISTQEAVTIRSRFVLPQLQAASVAISLVFIVVGVWLMTRGMAWLLALDWDMQGWLLAWVLFLLVAAATASAARWLLGKVKQAPRAAQAFLATGGALVVGLALGSVLLSKHGQGGTETLWMVIGAAMVLAYGLLAYNQANDLMNPYWRRSPFEQAITDKILPAFSGLLSDTGERAGVKVEDPRWVVRRPRFGQGPAVPLSAPLEEDEEEGDYELATIDPQVGNLVWFVRYAARVQTLTLRDLLIQPAPILPFSEEEGKPPPRLRKVMARRLLARGSTSAEVRVDDVLEFGLGAGGFWDLQGQGARAEWVVERAEALRKAEEMWRSVMGDAVPVPDYWTELRKAA